MKKILFLFLLTGPLILLAQTTGTVYPTGKVSRSIFFNDANKSIYENAYNSYLPNADAIKYLNSKKGKFGIKMVMGFWCDDSQKYAPQLLKTLDNAKWDTVGNNQLIVYGVDENKVANFEGFKEMNIINVPTIIVYQNNKEIGRIVETPKISVEQDLVNIIKSTE